MDGNLYTKDGTTLSQYAKGKAATSFAIPDGVMNIGNMAFYNCSGLTSITIPDGVMNIGNMAFYNCSGLTSITIPNSVTSIGDWAFWGCHKLVEVYDQSSLLITADSREYGYIGYYAKNVYTPTSGQSKLSYDNGYIVYTDGEEKILVGYMGTETELTLPSYITKINQWAFGDCENLTSVVIGDSVKDIGAGAFSSCENLTSVTIGNGVTSIGSSAFEDCDSLTSVTIPDRVTSIGSYAFGDCENLTSVTIGNGVTSIGDFAFYGCSSLTEINYNATECEDLSSSNYVFYNAGQSGDGITVTIGANVKKIPAYLFYPYSGSHAPKITTVVFEEGSVCESIGDYAFALCRSLTSVTIPDSVKSIGSNAFSGCSGLTIYCETESQPSGWNSSWNASNRPVEWGYKGE